MGAHYTQQNTVCILDLVVTSGSSRIAGNNSIPQIRGRKLRKDKGRSERWANHTGVEKRRLNYQSSLPKRKTISKEAK